MDGDIWPSNMTRHARYCKPSIFGDDSIISKCILLYSLIGSKKRLKILDVGCSTGSPARHLRGYLRPFGVSCTIDGMDASKEVMADATSNLGKFYLGNLFDISVEPIYDIAICSRLLRFLDVPKQCEGVSKCTSFCNNGGVVITDGIPNSCYAVKKHVMLPRAALLDEAARYMRVWKGKPESHKCQARDQTRLDTFYRDLESRFIRLCIDMDRKKWSNCLYCRGS